MRRHLKTCAVSVSCLPFLTLPALANPAGGHFVAGSGAVSANQLTVTQTSRRGIVDWTGFSIDPNSTVNINNGSGATLNRVTTSGSPSSIYGTLNSTGSVYLVNQYGIVVQPGGKVSTNGSFVASTRGISNDAFMEGGKLQFTGNSSYGVDNEGTINSANGDVVLIGKTATNGGTITAPNGTAAAVAGDDVLLQPGAGLQIKVNAGSGDATNNGTIAAVQAMLNAVGGNVYALAGNISTANASGVGNIDGHIWLTAGGSVDIEAPVKSSGAVTIDGDGAAYSKVEPNSGADGVYINQAVSAVGPISITGSGGNRGGQENYGVMIDANGSVQATGNAAINITGTGGGVNTGTFGNDGVFIYGTIAGNGAPVTITGTGGNSGGPDNFGVTNEGAVLNNANGNITIIGTSSGGPGAENPNSIGIGQVGVVNLGLVQSGTGNISITGTVGANATGAGNSGVGIGGGVIETTGNGNIDITGTSSGALGSNSGVLLLDYTAVVSGGTVLAPPSVTAVDGHIRVTGKNTGSDAGSDSGVAIVNGTIATAGHGDVKIIGNGGDSGTPGSDSGIAIGGTVADPASVTAGGKLKIKSTDGSVMLLPGGSLTAYGTGDALIIRAEHGGFMNTGGSISTPNGQSEIHTGDKSNDSDPDQGD